MGRTPLCYQSPEKQKHIEALRDTDLSRLTDSQVVELIDFYMGSSDFSGRQSSEWATAYAARATVCELESIRRLLAQKGTS